MMWLALRIALVLGGVLLAAGQLGLLTAGRAASTASAGAAR